MSGNLKIMLAGFFLIVAGCGSHDSSLDSEIRKVERLVFPAFLTRIDEIVVNGDPHLDEPLATNWKPFGVGVSGNHDDIKIHLIFNRDEFSYAAFCNLGERESAVKNGSKRKKLHLYFQMIALSVLCIR